MLKEQTHHTHKGGHGRRLMLDEKNEINVMIMTQHTTDVLMVLLWH